MGLGFVTSPQLEVPLSPKASPSPYLRLGLSFKPPSFVSPSASNVFLYKLGNKKCFQKHLVILGFLSAAEVGCPCSSRKSLELFNLLARSRWKV